MFHSEVKELIQAQQFIHEGKFDEALLLMTGFEERREKSLHDLVLCHLLKCDILCQQGIDKELVSFAEETYKESLGLGKNLLSVDALYYMNFGLLLSDNLEKAEEIIKQGEDLLKILTDEPIKDYKQREAKLANLKGRFYKSQFAVKSTDLMFSNFEKSLKLREQYGENHEIAESLLTTSQGLMFYKSELDQALEYIERALTLSKESNKKYNIAWSLFLKALCYQIKGDLDRCIKLYEQSLAMFRELNNKGYIGSILNNLADMYKMKGELDRALECSEQSLAVFNELKVLKEIAIAHDGLIQILIERGDLKKAQSYINQLEELNKKLKNKQINLSIIFNKALILKKSPRIINKGKAAETFKQIIEDKDSPPEIILRSLLNLCEVLLFELNATNEPEILDELHTYISRLLNIVKKSRSYWLLAETYLLQARVSLVTLNLNKARRLFSKSQNLAEKYGLNHLAVRISNEHDELLKQLEIWEKLKDSNAPLIERVELSHLNEQIERMVRSRIGESPKLEVEQPVLFIIMGQDGNIIMSNPFSADVKIDSAFFSEFLSSCNIFCDQILSESFDRVKFGEYTVLITALDSLSVGYMFQGQSYSARQKLLHFSETVKKYPNIMNMLEDAGKKKLEIKVNEIPSLEELIYECFLSDPHQFQMPFKAYEGDRPFVFVSYSHTDRLQVYPIIDYLNKTGIKVWYDEGIPVSEDWKSSIVDNLERCSAFLVFITPRIIDSEYVRKEISFALKKNKLFFSVYLKETELPSKLEFEIGDIQFMKKYLMSEFEFYNKLSNMLKSAINV